MVHNQISKPEHLFVNFTADEYQVAEKAAAESGQSVNDALYAALLVKLGATMQDFVSEYGLRDLVIEVNIENLADDVTREDLDALYDILGEALDDFHEYGLALEDHVIDFTELDKKTEITDLDEWEQNS